MQLNKGSLDERFIHPQYHYHPTSRLMKYFVTCQPKKLYMKPYRARVNRTVIFFIFISISISFLNSCAVVKTPYFKTSYYKETVLRLESIKSGANMANGSLYAGFSKKSITPEIKDESPESEYGQFDKVPIAGYGQIKQKIATGINDSIFIRAIALTTGLDTIIIISGDLLIMPPDITDSVSSILLKKGIRRNQLYFSASHTHSSIGGWGYGIMARLMAGKEDFGIKNWLVNQITDAALSAISDLRPAKIGYDSFNASPYIRDRLTGDQNKKNNEFNYIVIIQADTKKAIIGSFSAHSTTIGRKNLLISGDYPGFWERKLEDSTCYLAMFCGGSMASQSPVGQGGEFESARYIGESLADSLSDQIDKIKFHEQITLSSLSLKIDLPEYHFRLTKNINLSTGLSNKLMPIPEKAYLQALRFNNLIWFLTPGDFSGELALQAKKILKGQGYETFVTGYNGSYTGYIIPGKYFYLDHYESKGMGWFGPTMGDYIMDLMDQMSNILIQYNIN